MRNGLRLGISSATYDGGGSPVDYLATFDAMFASSEAGEIWPVHEDYFFTDTACTTPVSAVGQEVKGWLGRKYGNAFTQGTAGRIPLYCRQPAGGWTQQFLQSDNLDTTPWTLTRITATGGQTDFDGGSNGWLLQNTTTNQTTNIGQPASRGDGAHHFSAYVKAGTTQRVLIGQYLTAGYSDSIFDLTSGTWIVSGSGVTLGATDVGSGWWLLSLTYTGVKSDSTTLPVYYIGPIRTNGTTNINTTAGDNIVVYRPMLNRGSSRATYEARGALYEGPATGDSVAALYFDGVSDSMVSSAIDFTSCNEMSVWLGWEKWTRQNTFGAVVELSAAANSNNGTFLVLENGNNYNWYFGCRGNTLYERYLTQQMAPRNRALVAASFDLSAGASAIAASVTDHTGNYSALTTASGTTPGTGNFGNYPLYIGARGGGTTLEANGYFVGALVVLGRAATAQELTDGDAALVGLS